MRKFIHRHIWPRILVPAFGLLVAVLGLFCPLRVVSALTGTRFTWDGKP